MACGPNIIYGNAWYRTIEEKHEPIFELRPVHGYVNTILQKFYGVPVATANDAVVKWRVPIMDREHDGEDPEQISAWVIKQLMSRGDV